MVEDRGLRARDGPRRPPRQRHQAPERARRRVPRPRARTSSPSAIGPAGYIGPVGADVPILLDDAVEPGAYVTGANRDERAPARRRARPRLPVQARRRAHVEAGDTVGGHPIRIEPAIEVGNIFKLGTRFSEPLGATYLDESGHVAADLDGLLRPRAGADRRRRGRAVRRRAGHLVAALAGAVRRRSWSGSAARAPRSASWPSASTRSCARPGLDVALRRPRRRPGREVRRRGAARRAAAADRRPADARPPARSRRRCAAGARRARSRWRAPPRRRWSCGAASRKRRRAAAAGPPREAGQDAVATRAGDRREGAADVPAAVGPRPLRPAAAADAARASRCTRGRSRTRSASSGSR